MGQCGRYKKLLFKRLKLTHIYYELTFMIDERYVLKEDEIQEIRSRCDAATPGPWTAYIEGRDHTSGSDFIMTGAFGDPDCSEDMEITGATIADYDFIAHARQDIPRLLEEIERLKKERA